MSFTNSPRGRNVRTAVLVEMDHGSYDAHLQDRGPRTGYLGPCTFIAFVMGNPMFEGARSWPEINAVAKKLGIYHRVWFSTEPELLTPGMRVRRTDEHLLSVVPFDHDAEIIFDRGSGVAVVHFTKEGHPLFGQVYNLASDADGNAIPTGENAVYAAAAEHGYLVRCVPRAL